MRGCLRSLELESGTVPSETGGAGKGPGGRLTSPESVCESDLDSGSAGGYFELAGLFTKMSHPCRCGHAPLDHECHGEHGNGKGYCTMIDEEGERCRCLEYAAGAWQKDVQMTGGLK